uniref:PKHD1 like 1, tandem duplicate 1 n=1 Tax=Oreochromis niloticus TaxID=8128 RepID=A0A669C1W9_ORENI
MEVKWKAAALLLALWCCCDAQRVTSVSPRRGSVNGATRLTIQGDGFAQERQFQLNPVDDMFGNRVTLVSNTLSVPCDVERDSTHSNQIMCYTRPMPYDDYEIHVSVDGVPIPDNSMCRYSWLCIFTTVSYRTPTIESLSPVSGPPGTLVTVYGRIFTDVYGSNTDLSSNGINARFLRSHSFFFTICRSEAVKKLYRVSALGKLSMFQTFAEVTGVFPSEGSIMGGTLLTVQGRFFDETDQPARVLVGGLPCEVQSVDDDRITCKTAEHQTNKNAAVYPGGRGLKMEVWNNSRPSSLSSIWSYNKNTTGYWSQWIDSMPHVFPREMDYFTTRFTGFFVPPATGNYTIYLQCDDRCDLYLSNSSRPENKVKVAYQPYYVSDYTQLASQKSKVLALEKDKPYYMEILQQEYGGAATINFGLFQGESSYTEDQTDDAVNEVQNIVADYDVFDEEQVVTFDMWPASVAGVKEVQNVTVSSSSCSDALSPITVSASAAEVEAALNSLWSIKPDTVMVTKQQSSEGSHFIVTFNSDRGDFEPLHFEVFGSDTNITVTEVTKGRSNMKTFTLLWGGIPTKPIAFNASESEVQSALEDLMKAECPGEILTFEGTDVKYFKDFENNNSQFNIANEGTPVDHSGFCGRWSLRNAEILFKDSYTTDFFKNIHLMFFQLCFAYKGMLKDEVGMRFTYQDNKGQTLTLTTKINTIFNKGSKSVKS